MRAYVATAHRLIEFLGRYRGEAIDAAALTSVNAADLRAFLADRRASGLGAASAARELSGVRAFLIYVAEQQGVAAQLPRTRAPKRPRTLPRPAAPDDAVNLAEDAAQAASAPWIGARDLAILLLLFTILITTGLGLLTPLIFRDLIDHTLPTGDVGRLNLLAGALIAIPIMNGLIGLWSDVVRGKNLE